MHVALCRPVWPLHIIIGLLLSGPWLSMAMLSAGISGIRIIAAGEPVSL